MRSGVTRFWRWSRSTMKSGTLVYDKHNGIILNIHDPWLTVFLGHPVHSKFLTCEDEMAGLFIVVSVLLWSQRCHCRNAIECHVTFIFSPTCKQQVEFPYGT
ncbi:unnamed protein product [Sphagnum compactum]